MKQKLVILAVAMAATLGAWSAVAKAATNLITNNSFETSTGNAAPGWTAESWGSLTKSAVIVTGDGQTGTHSAKITVSNFKSGDARWQSTPVTVTGGQTFNYSSWYKSNVATEVDAEVVLTNGQTTYLWLGDVAASTTWKQLKYTVKVPANAKSLSIYHLIDRNGWLQTDEYNLDVQGAVTPSPTPTTPAPTPTSPAPTPTSPAPTPVPTTPAPTPVPTSPAPTPVPTTPVPTPVPTTPPPTPVPTPVPPVTTHAPFSRPLATIEFDDGWTSAYLYGLPTVESFGWRPLQYVITDTAVNNANYGTGTYMTAAQIKDWKLRGDIGSHTVDHADLITLNAAQITTEMTNAKIYLDALLGTPTKLFATPYCDSNATVVSVAKTLYQDQRNCDGEVNTKANFDRYNVSSFMILSSTTDAEIVAQLNAAKASNGWVDFVWHQVAGNTGDAYSVSQATLKHQLQLIKDSGVTVVTTQQALNESLGL